MSEGINSPTISVFLPSYFSWAPGSSPRTDAYRNLHRRTKERPQVSSSSVYFNNPTENKRLSVKPAPQERDLECDSDLDRAVALAEVRDITSLFLEWRFPPCWGRVKNLVGRNEDNSRLVSRLGARQRRCNKAKPRNTIKETFFKGDNWVFFYCVVFREFKGIDNKTRGRWLAVRSFRLQRLTLATLIFIESFTSLHSSFNTLRLTTLDNQTTTPELLRTTMETFNHFYDFLKASKLKRESSRRWNPTTNMQFDTTKAKS